MQFDTYAFIRPVNKVVECIEKVVVMIFPQHFDEILRSSKNLPDAFALYSVRSMAKNIKIDNMTKVPDDDNDINFAKTSLGL